MNDRQEPNVFEKQLVEVQGVEEKYQLQMNWMCLRNNRLRFETLGKLLVTNEHDECEKQLVKFMTS